MVNIVSLPVNTRAYRSGVRAGDRLTEINGHPIGDVLDYRFYLAEREVTLSLLRPDGTPYEVSIRKGIYDDIGLEFPTPLMDEKQSCRNKCIFCFIDQLPPGMRKTLYFKDDDARLSFLHGNYITMTNLTESDIDRIITMHISPINVSVHTTNPELRVRMMKNKHAGEVLAYLPKLAAAGITLRAQIVLCHGINDGAELDRTMRDLTELAPALDSVSIVPAGMTAYREKLYPLTSFSPEEAREVIRQVDVFADKCRARLGSRLFFCGDELYLTAGIPVPSEPDYEGYPQLENGVGMLRSAEEEFIAALEDETGEVPPRSVTLATGEAAADLMRRLTALACAKFPMLSVRVEVIRNDFFGPGITVSGLLTGRDIQNQLQGKELGDALLIPENALRAGEDVFLCNMMRGELSEALGVPVIPSGDGAALLNALLGR